jgi:predicted O-methyltransferase YrrM
MLTNRTEVSELVLNMNCKRIAEIGVSKCRLVKHVMESDAGKVLDEYWAIDYWPTHVQDQYLYALKVSTYYPKVHIVKLTSLEAATIFPDKYFDLVFIDANHSYQSVLEDINAWVKKVRSGGIICGHDFWEEPCRHPGVARAVRKSFKDVHVSTETSIWRCNIS